MNASDILSKLFMLVGIFAIAYNNTATTAKIPTNINNLDKK